MKKQSWERAATAAVLALCAALAACGDRVEDNSAPQAAPASAEIDRQDAQGATDTSEAAAVDHASNAIAAPAAEDPDTRIAAEVKSTLVADPDFSAMKIDVHSDDGAVTLRGRAPDPAARERASDIVRTVRDVKSVDNQLTLG